MISFDLNLVGPVITLVFFGLFVLLLTPFFRRETWVFAIVSLIGILTAGYLTSSLWRAWRALGAMETGAGMVRVDGFGLLFSGILLVVGALSVLASMRFLEREEADHGEFYALILIGLAGMLVMVNTTHLIMVLIGLEVFSICLYVLTGLTRSRAGSIEAALKYFLLGAFSSGFMIYGLALLYGATGTLRMEEIANVVATAPSTLLWLGMGLVLIGFAFKIAAVPFHFWVPDVYQGAPTNVTAFMAAATKTVAFAALLRFLPGAFGEQTEVWVPVVTWLSILTMTVANLVALAQTNVKRLLAFSSISHAGYLLIALVCRPERAVSAIAFYLTAYAFMTVGAFVVAAAVGRGDSTSEAGYDLWDWQGLGWRRPGLGVAMTVFLFSLAGIPPTAGFLGKYVIFQAAVDSGRWLLAIVGVLNAVVGAYYYLRVIVSMWMRESETDEQPLPVTISTAIVLIVAVVGVFYLGLAPGALLDAAQGLYALLI
jgi:NADH-quinone oxidoreductase subunit N